MTVFDIIVCAAAVFPPHVPLPKRSASALNRINLQLRHDRPPKPRWQLIPIEELSILGLHTSQAFSTLARE